MLVLDAGVAIPGFAKARVPALDVTDRNSRERQSRDRVLLDASHATLLITRRRRRPRGDVLVDPRVEDIGDGATGGRRLARSDCELGRDAQRISLAAMHRARQLRGSAAIIGTGEDPHFPHAGPLLAYGGHSPDLSQIIGMVTRDGLGSAD